MPQIKLEGYNKQLLNEYIFEKYEAQKAEKENKWFLFKKHSDAAEQKLKFILSSLNISSVSNSIHIDAEHSCLIVTSIRKEDETMKNGKRLTKKEKILLENQGYDYKNYLRVMKTAENIKFINIHTGKTIDIKY